MSTIASTLLDFILDLFRDPEKAAEYEKDPQGALDAAGLDATPEEVDDLLPMVADYATVGGWGGHGGHDHDDEGGHDHDDKGAHCDSDDEDEDKGGYHHRPADDDHEDHHHGGLAPVDRDECEDEDDEGHSGGGHHGHGHAGGTETVVIAHLQEVHYTHNETTVEIDASHSIWVSGDAQAIFGDVKGDVTQIDNEGGIVAGDDVEDSDIDNSDNSINDSFNTDVDIEDSNVNVGGDQAVDSFNEDNDGVDVEKIEDSFNGNDIGSHNEDNDVIADRGGQVGDNTAVRVEDVNVNTGDGTLVDDSTNSGNSAEIETDVHVEDVNVETGDGDLVDGDQTEIEFDESFNDNSQDNDTTVKTEVEFEESFNTEESTELVVEDSTVRNSDLEIEGAPVA